jgi:hypothetical protein
MKIVLSVLLVLAWSGILTAQTPGVASPVNLDLGLGGGVSIPSGDLANVNATGYHAGAKLRVKSLLPMNIVVAAAYNRLPEKGTDHADAAWMIGGGLEYALPGVGVSPYLGVDATLNIFDNQGTGTSSTTRGGLGFGGGILFALPGFGSFDAGVKYQMLNVMGKEAGEPDLTQVAATVTIMASIL